MKKIYNNTMKIFLLLVVSVVVTSSILNAQTRDLRSERIILDDNNGNTIVIQTPAGPITGGTLIIPDPGGSGQFLITNPSGGSQSVSGDILPGADDTYDLGSGASRWQDIFSSGNNSVGGQVRFVETGGGTDYVGFQAPAAITANQIWTLPAADGTSGQVLTTDGSGILSWTSPSTGPASFTSTTTTPALSLNNTNGTNAKALSIAAGGGRIILSYGTGAGVIPTDVSVWNATGNVTLPGSTENGQTLYIVNTSGANITVTGVTGGTAAAFGNNDVRTYIYAGGWFELD